MGDLLRLLAVTTVALVAVIAFAGALKPLADGRLTLDQALRFMGYLIVPMTQFALPFAAGFAATLTYHRFAADNEAMASAAAGLGHKSVLTPALVLGVSLSLFLGVMSFQLIPPLLRDAQRVLVTDGTRVLASQLNRGEAVRLRFGGSDAIDLYADVAFPAQAPEPGSDAERRGVDRIITLEGVLVVDAKSEEGAPTYASAERVFLLIYEEGDASSVELILENPRITIDGAGGRAESQRLFTERMSLPSEIADDPKFLTWAQMSEAERTPRIMNKTDRNARVLEARLVERDSVTLVETMFAQSRSISFVVDALGEGATPERVRVEAGGMLYDPVAPTVDPSLTGEEAERAERRARRERIDRWALAPDEETGFVRVVRTLPEGNRLTHLAKRAALKLPIERPGANEGVTRFRLELEDVVTLEGAPDPPYALTGSEPSAAELNTSSMLPEGLTGVTYAGEPVTLLIEQARDQAWKEHPLTPRIRSVMRSLRDRVDEQNREIASKRHERLAFSAACLVMVLVGACVAMNLRDSLPLPVYLWSFLPALGTIISISAGQRLVHREGAIGFILLWGGVAALSALLLRAYARLRRH